LAPYFDTIFVTKKTTFISQPIEKELQDEQTRHCDALRSLVEQKDRNKGLFLSFALQNEGGPLPLGWVLSEVAKETIQEQLGKYLDQLKDPLEVKALRQAAKTSPRFKIEESKQLPATASLPLRGVQIILLNFWRSMVSTKFLEKFF
jgi:hypothetical protein